MYAINHKWPISESFKFWITLFESTIVALTDTTEIIVKNYSSLKKNSFMAEWLAWQVEKTMLQQDVA